MHQYTAVDQKDPKQNHIIISDPEINKEVMEQINSTETIERFGASTHCW